MPGIVLIVGEISNWEGGRLKVGRSLKIIRLPDRLPLQINGRFPNKRGTAAKMWFEQNKNYYW